MGAAVGWGWRDFPASKPGDVVWAVFPGVAGVVFLSVYIRNRAHWWALIPAMTLLGLMVLILMGEYFPQLEDAWGGSVILGAIGLSFWAIAITNRQAWWSVIPAGVLTTLAAITFIEPMVAADVSGGVFFLGLGLTFLLVGVFPTSQGRMRWAFIPSAVLLLMGVFLMASLVSLLDYLWPVALILLGIYLIYRYFSAGKSREVD